MSTFVSVSDLIENNQSLNFIKEELFVMKTSVNSAMDKGLTVDEMEVAKKVQEAVRTADDVLAKL